jgi:copper resistance protein B
MKMPFLLAATSAIAFAAPAVGQTMDHSNMPGMKMPAKPAPKPGPAAKPDSKPVAPAKPTDVQAAPAENSICPPEHAAMGHCTPSTPAPPAQADPHAGHDMSAMPGMTADAEGMGAGGTALPASNAPAPAAPEPSYADRVWGREAMAPARNTLRREHGGGTFSQIMFNLAEYQVRGGRDGFHWDGEGWFGGDINRLVIKSEGSGAVGEGIEDAEIQALYSRAIGPYFNLQAGVRYDIKPNPSRTYATVGFEGLAPYWFEVEGALFLSDKGDVLARLEGYYDQRITQRLILQPRAEFNLAAQDVPENGIGSGLSDIELGLRLRYEIAREFAPYVGVSWDRKVGDTADFARAAGEDPSSASLVLGVRAWF